jgi:hypothetical protein
MQKRTTGNIHRHTSQSHLTYLISIQAEVNPQQFAARARGNAESFPALISNQQGGHTLDLRSGGANKQRAGKEDREARGRGGGGRRESSQVTNMLARSEGGEDLALIIGRRCERRRATSMREPSLPPPPPPNPAGNRFRHICLCRLLIVACCEGENVQVLGIEGEGLTACSRYSILLTYRSRNVDRARSTKALSQYCIPLCTTFFIRFCGVIVYGPAVT